MISSKTRNFKSSLSSLMLFVMKLAIVLILPISTLVASSINSIDEFTAGHLNGWQGDGYTYNNNGWLYIDRDKTAYKTFNFGTSNANANITITFEYWVPSAWETSGSYVDYMIVFKNDTEEIGRYTNDGIFQRRHIKTTLDSNGSIKLSFMPDTTANNEWAGINLVMISNDNTNYSSPNLRTFDIHKQDNIRGNLKIIGNSIMLDHDGTCPPETTNNNSLNVTYADRDNDNSTYNSTSSNLVLPKGVGSEDVLYAILYWQGRLAHTNRIGFGRTVKIKPYGSDSYINISSIDSKFNWESSRLDYQGVADITDIIKTSIDTVDQNTISQDGYNHPFWVADVYARLGENTFGAWSLVVGYKNESDTLKNLTLYDGYDHVFNNSITITLDDFLTPTNGDVSSNFFVFAGEGDISLSDSATLTDNNGDEISLGDNVFKSSVDFDGTNITNRNPSCQNTIGIDLRGFSIGTTGAIPIIGNNQTSTDIKIVSTGDHIVPGMFAFTTDLYEPRVCYFIDTIKDDDNVTVFENRRFTQEIKQNENYKFDLWISNMRKSATDAYLETAKLVQVYLTMTNFDYKEHSTLMQNLGDTNKNIITDHKSDDKGEFEDDDNKSIWRVGVNANSSQGGSLNPASDFADNAKKAFIALEGKFLIDDNATNIDLLNHFLFKASFQTDTITIGSDNAQIIDQCIDLDTTGAISKPPIGGFNIVNEIFTGASMQDDFKHYTNALYTQVAGQEFEIKILSLDTTDTTDPINIVPFEDGNISLSIIKTPDYSSCADDDIECKQEKCDSRIPISGMAINNIDFDADDTADGNRNGIITQSYTPNQAHQNVSFRVTFTNNLNQVAHACSLDSFAIRPKSYSFDMNETRLIGGRQYQLNTNATSTLNDNNLTGYTHATTDANLTSSLIIPPGCTGVADDNSSTNITFINGNDTSFIRTGNIGDYNISIKDLSWTNIDQNSFNNKGFNDCIPDSNASSHDSSGKVGCNILNSKVFTFSPKKFINTLSIENFNTNGFTYIAGNDSNMSADLDINITAILEDDSTATSYSAGCYAKDINTTITLMSDPPPTQWLTNDTNATYRIRFFDDDNTTKVENNSTGTATLSSGEGNFTNGVANILAHFNFTRNINTPDEPFDIRRNDFNITIVDTADTNGTDFSRTNDHNATFYYGRVHAPDQRFVGGTGDAKVFYEVYCDDCVKSDFNITGDESIDSIDWYVNKLHTNLSDGNVLEYSSASGVTFGSTSSTSISGGVETVVLTAPKLPHKDKIDMNASSWLEFHPPMDFLVEFHKEGAEWAGEGKLGDTVDINISARQNRRLDW